MIDLLLVIAYLSMIGVTKKAIAPALAFIATILVSKVGLEMAIQHTVYIFIYVFIMPFAAVKIAYVMGASTIVNLIAVAYYLLPAYVPFDYVYFIVTMSVVNLCILFTVFKGSKDGDWSNSDNSVFARLFNILNLQPHSKTGAGR